MFRPPDRRMRGYHSEQEVCASVASLSMFAAVQVKPKVRFGDVFI